MSHARTCTLTCTPQVRASIVSGREARISGPNWIDGAWRSPVARLNGVQEVASSNLAAPIGRKPVKWRAFLHLGTSRRTFSGTNCNRS